MHPKDQLNQNHTSCTDAIFPFDIDQLKFTDRLNLNMIMTLYVAHLLVTVTQAKKNSILWKYFRTDQECILEFNFLLEGEEILNIAWVLIVYHASTQYCIKSTLDGITHNYIPEQKSLTRGGRMDITSEQNVLRWHSSLARGGWVIVNKLSLPCDCGPPSPIPHPQIVTTTWLQFPLPYSHPQRR